MKRQEAEAVIARLENEGIVSLINDEMVRQFGVLANYKARVLEDYRRDCCLRLEDQNDDVTKQLTATRLLRQMFAGGAIYMDGYYFPAESGMTESGEDELLLWLRIGYKHTGGGSNGLQLGSMVVRLNSKTVTMR